MKNSKTETGILRIHIHSEDDFKYPFLRMRLTKQFPKYTRGLKFTLNPPSVYTEPVFPIIEDNILLQIDGEQNGPIVQFNVDVGEYYASIDNGYNHPKTFQPLSKTRSDYDTLILFGYKLDENDYRTEDIALEQCELHPFKKDFIDKLGSSSMNSKSYCPKIKILPNQTTEIHIQVSKNHLDKLSTFLIWVPLGIGLYPLLTGFSISARDVTVTLNNPIDNGNIKSK